MTKPEMNGFERFDNESFTVSYKSNTKEVLNLSGWRHKETQEVIFDPKTDSAERYSNAYDELIKKDKCFIVHDKRTSYTIENIPEEIKEKLSSVKMNKKYNYLNGLMEEE